MFRIKENPDGTISIFSNDQNRSFICSVDGGKPNKNNVKTPPKKQPIQTNGAIPTSPTRYLVSKLSPNIKKNGPSAQRPTRVRPRQAKKVFSYDDDKDETSSVSSLSSRASTFSLASVISVESSAEPDDDCIDQWSFCRMIDLIDSKRLQSSTAVMQELGRTFPMRKISCQSRWEESKKRLPKRTDVVDICSTLGQNILNAHPKSMVPDTSDSVASKYERFCKSSAMSLQPFVWQSPLLRIREVRSKFPVTYKRSNGYIRKYSFSRKQRLQRYEQLKLGLNRRSYLQKLKCKKVSVKVQRLSQKTIDLHCKKQNTSEEIVIQCQPSAQTVVPRLNNSLKFVSSKIYDQACKPVTNLLRRSWHSYTCGGYRQQ